MKILYISDNYLDLSVFVSQVHTLCNYHAAKNQVKLIALCNHKEIKSAKLEDAQYELIKIYRFPRMFIPMVNQLRTYTLTKQIKKHLEWADVIHCRGHFGSAFGINLRKRFKIHKPLIADIRGEYTEELKGDKLFFSNFYTKQATKIEKFVFQNSDALFFVSESMEVHYRKKFQIQQQSYVFPTLVDDQYFFYSKEFREQTREQLNIGERQTYIYVGGIAYWQNLDQIILKFNALNQASPHDYFFIILTTEPKWVHDFCQQKGISMVNFHVDRVPYQDVSKYINAADYGVIIRDDNLINQVASPTKLNEYFACKKKVIHQIDEIGVNNHYLFKEHKTTKSIVEEQNEIYELLSDKMLGFFHS